MSLSKSLFRESALERLSSPEQLDQQLQVTSPKGWISLIAIGALLATVIAWSFLGTVPSKEEGHGIIVAGGGLRLVVSPGTGRLSSISVGVDDRVARDQIVARIDKHDLIDQLAEASSQLEELRAQQETLVEFDAREEELQESLAKVETRRLQQKIEFSQARLQRLASRRTIIAELVADGMMTEIDRDKVDEDIETTQLGQEQARLEIEQVAAKNRNDSFSRERERMKRKMAFEELEGKVAMLRSRLERESQVRSPFAGRVVEVRAAVQTAVTVGDPILLVEPAESASGELEAILYVSAATGKRVKEKMEVHISPSTVKREEYGSMVGEVSFIADVPTSKSAMLAVLSDADLVEKFTDQIGLPLEMRVSLVTDSATASGYRWTSSLGPPARISAGTLCSGWVTVHRKRPVELVIPLARKKLGAD